MKTKINKQNSIYLKTLAIAALPLALMSSCSQEAGITNVDLKLNSVENPTISLKEISDISFVPQDITASNLETIKKVFDIGENSEAQIVEALQVRKLIISTNEYKLILISKTGFEINNSLEYLMSHPFLVGSNFDVGLPPTEEIHLKTVSQKEIDLISEERQNIDEFNIPTIKKVFNISHDDQVMIDNFHVKKIVKTAKSNSYHLVLIAKDGLLINGKRELMSNNFNAVDTSVDVDLEINALNSKFDITEEQIKYFGLDFKNVDQNTLKIIKLAFGINVSDEIAIEALSVKIEQISQANNKYKFVLMVNEGFTMNGTKLPFNSKEFVVYVDFTINKESTISGMTIDEIKTFQDEFTAVTEEQIISLKKVFDFGDIPSLFC
jgi:hypothetical protein